MNDLLKTPRVNTELELQSFPNITYFHTRLSNPRCIQTSVCSKDPEVALKDLINAAFVLANGIHDMKQFMRGNFEKERMLDTVNIYYQGVVFAVRAGGNYEDALSSYHYAKESIDLSQQGHNVAEKSPYLIREFVGGPKEKSRAFLYRIK